MIDFNDFGLLDGSARSHYVKLCEILIVQKHGGRSSTIEHKGVDAGVLLEHGYENGKDQLREMPTLCEQREGSPARPGLSRCVCNVCKLCVHPLCPSHPL